MNTQRLQAIAAKQQYTILPVKTGYQLEIHEKVGEGNNQRIRKFKGLVIKVKKPKHADGTFTVRGKVAGMNIEKIYPLSFPNFEKVILIDAYKIRQAKIYYIREKIGKDARMKSISTAEQRNVDLFALAKSMLPEVAEQKLPDPQNDEDITAQVMAEETEANNEVAADETAEVAVETVTTEAAADVATDEESVASASTVEETPEAEVAQEEVHQEEVAVTEAPVTNDSQEDTEKTA